MHWETISYQRGKEKIFHSYHHFTLKKQETHPSHTHVDAFYRLMNSLDVEKTANVTLNPEGLSKIMATLSRSSKVDFNVDIYLTEKGIQTLRKLKPIVAKRAFLETLIEIEPTYADLPVLDETNYGAQSRKIIDDYWCAFKKDSFSNFCGRDNKIRELKQQYFEVTGRDLYADAKISKAANTFAHQFSKLRTSNQPTQIAKFFGSLRQYKGIPYLQSVSILRKLAGPGEVLIHELSMHSKNVYLRLVDEGKIEHPKDAVKKHASRGTLNH